MESKTRELLKAMDLPLASLVKLTRIKRGKRKRKL